MCGGGEEQICPQLLPILQIFQRKNEKIFLISDNFD